VVIHDRGALISAVAGVEDEREVDMEEESENEETGEGSVEEEKEG
jgi:hypothetical protein